MTTPTVLAPFRPSSVRAKWAMALVGITTAVVAGETLVVLNGFTLIDNIATTTTAEITQWARTLDGSGSLYILVLIPSAIALLAWLSRVVDNVPALGGGEPSVSPRAAIGWWFVPFANFVKPYAIVADVWRRLGAIGSRGPALIIAWWVLWIGGSIAARVLVAMPSPDTISGFKTLLTEMTVTLSSQVLAGGILIWIIWEMEQRVVSRSAALVPVAAAPAVSPAAGRPTTIAFCPSCGASRVAGTRFCGGCGFDLVALAPQPV